jgi:hypothetical protein
VFYGGRGNLWSGSVETYNRRGWEDFACHVWYDIGDGSKVLFWHDVRCGELPLKIVFQNCTILHVTRMRGWSRIWRP